MKFSSISGTSSVSSSISGLFVTDQRRSVIDDNAIVKAHHVIVIVNPNEILNWMTFISPLTFHSWIVVVAAILGGGLTLALSGHLFEGERCNKTFHSESASTLIF